MRRRHPPLELLFTRALLGLAFVSCLCLSLKAQTCTSQNSATPNKAGWIKGSNVQVYIDPSITGTQRQAIADAFNSWNGANSSSNPNGNSSRVSYTIVSSPPPAGSNSFTISSTAPVANAGARAETTAFVDQYGHTISATTLLDPHVTNPASILEVMVHEIGHPAGFGNCIACATGDSVMANGPAEGDYNAVVGRPTSPTACDNHNLQATDYPYCTPPPGNYTCNADPNTLTCQGLDGGGGGGVGGESGGGGGHVAPVCTDYYWYYYSSYDGGQTWQLDGMEYAGCW